MTKITQDPDSQMDKQNSGVAAVDRALLILDAFDVDSPVLSLAEISRRTKLYKSTILRLLSSLERHGYVVRNEDGQFSLGITPLKLSRIYQNSFNLKDVIYPILERITKETGETSSFYILDHDKRVVLFRIEPVRSVKVSISEGDTFPVNVGASGKILRAFSQTEIEVDETLQQIQNQFWASSFGERDPETSSLSVPVFSNGKQLQGALTISGPSERLTQEKIAENTSLLLECSIQVSKYLAGSIYGLEDAIKLLKAPH
ncbi:IclR family transcriptional regulator [Acinetobacter lactucae]|uniref:IclR family transcriptional regulator n=1 Tax=Acinetobacter lactucae TaxID=1785128 RepID=UPI00077E36A1|nr:IclR family transcriptional regulator [Acinetobacter lactucae]